MIPAVQVRGFAANNSLVHPKTCCQKIQEVVQKAWNAFKRALNALLKPCYRCCHNYSKKVSNFRDNNFFDGVQREARLLPPDQLTKGLLFEVRDNAGASKGYLFGTIHALTREEHHWHSSILEKFHDSTHLGIEYNCYDYDVVQEGFRTQRAGYDDFFNDPGLDQNAIANAAHQVQSACVRLGRVTPHEIHDRDQVVQRAVRDLPVNEADKWKHRMNLAFYANQLTGRMSDVGADDRLVAAAQRSDKPVIPLENAEMRNLYSRLNCASKYRQWLGKNVDEIVQLQANIREYDNRWADAWRRGDFAAFSQIGAQEDADEILRNTQDPVLVGILRQMNDTDRARNIQMANTVDQFIRRGEGKLFAAFGCEHLRGQEGVVELLRQRGWTVQQVGIPQFQVPEVPIQLRAAGE